MRFCLGHARGLDELRDLTARTGFAPVIFIAMNAAHGDSAEAKEIGAHAVLGRDELNTEKFFQVLDDAEWVQSRARTKWRTSPVGRETQRFGSAFIRGYRCIRPIATGPVSDLVSG